jgi:hypothetical protein
MNLANLLYIFISYYNNPTNSNNEVDDDFPSINELLAFPSKGISIVY